MTTATAQSTQLSNNTVQPFKLLNYSDKDVRIVLKEQNPWFVASDICSILELKNITKAILTLDEDEKDDITISNTINRKQKTKFISESGLYALIFKSRKEEAKKFRKWVTSEVLPSIRKTGQYKLETTFQAKIDSLQQTIETVVNEKLALQSTYSHLAELHNKLRMKRNYHKFKKGNCVYIVTDRWREKDYLKIGYTNNINARLRTYRTSMPDCKINFLVYLTEHKLLESCLKNMFSDKMVQKNHEYVLDVEEKTLVKSITSLVKYLKMDATYEDKLALYNEPYKTYNLVFVDQDGNIEDNTEPIDIETEDEKSDPEPESEEEPELYNCKICTKEYRHKGNLVNHLRKVHNEEDDGKTCQVCKKVFRDRGKRNRHVRVIHEKSTKVNCPECKKEFSTRDTMLYHLRNIHKKLGRSKCDQCDKVCSNPGNLRKHITQMHDKNTGVECHICAKEFNSQCNLTQHILKVHERREKCKCTICDKILLSKNGLEYHMRVSHNI